MSDQEPKPKMSECLEPVTPVVATRTREELPSVAFTVEPGGRMVCLIRGRAVAMFSCEAKHVPEDNDPETDPIAINGHVLSPGHGFIEMRIPYMKGMFVAFEELAAITEHEKAAAAALEGYILADKSSEESTDA